MKTVYAYSIFFLLYEACPESKVSIIIIIKWSYIEKIFYMSIYIGYM